MYELVFLIFLASFVFTIFFLTQWYRPFFTIWPSSRIAFAKKYFILLPIVILVLYVVTVSLLASYDVVISGFYKFFYIVLGFLWTYLAMIAVSYFLGLSWKDDVFHINNVAAMRAIAGVYVAVSLIYAGANIGDGPGWWCVIVAGGLGLFLFLVLMTILHKWTGVLDTITIGRDKNTGTRMGMFFVACGIILARASGGDWVSFSRTVRDFWVAWPILVLSVWMVIIERLFKLKNSQEPSPVISFFIGLIYIGIAITSLFYLPALPENPVYGLVLGV